MHSRGFSLLEVLISLFVLSAALLAMDVLEVKSLQASRSEYFYAVAVNQLNSLAEIMRNKFYKTNQDRVFARWNAENNQVLPKGGGAYTDNDTQKILTIQWGDRANTCETTAIGLSGCVTLVFNKQA